MLQVVSVYALANDRGIFLLYTCLRHRKAHLFRGGAIDELSLRDQLQTLANLQWHS